MYFLYASHMWLRVFVPKCVIYLMNSTFHVCSLPQKILLNHVFSIYMFIVASCYYTIIICVSCSCIFKLEVFLICLVFEHVIYRFLHEKCSFCMNFSKFTLYASTHYLRGRPNALIFFSICRVCIDSYMLQVDT